MTSYICDQCDGTGYGRDGKRCPCRDQDDTAAERRARMQVVRPRNAPQEPAEPPEDAGQG